MEPNFEKKGGNVGSDAEVENIAKRLAEIEPWDTDFGGYDNMASCVNDIVGAGPIKDELIERAMTYHSPEDRPGFLKMLFIARPQEMLPKIENLLTSGDENLRYAAIIGLLRVDEKRAMQELRNFCDSVEERESHFPKEWGAKTDLSIISEDLFYYDRLCAKELLHSI